MKISLYGVRGSIASPGVETVRYGGNTACVFVQDELGSQLIFDAGTGIRVLGEDLLANDRPIHMFFSHYHWDHIQGFPFFRPAYQQGREVFLLADHLLEDPHSVLMQMRAPHFPVQADKLKAAVSTLSLASGLTRVGNITIHTLAANHPGQCCAYRLVNGTGSFAYVTDNELHPPEAPRTSYAEWVSFLQDTSLLLHDAMYMDNEQSHYHGWGHSVVSETLQLACDAHVKNLILFHHEPGRSDAILDRIGEESNEWMQEHNPNPCQVFVAREGDCYQITAGGSVSVSRKQE